MTRPNAYVGGMEFGRVAAPDWTMPPGSTESDLDGAVLQHLIAVRINAALLRRKMSRAAYARAVSANASALTKRLSGERPMRAVDIADAIRVLGYDVIPPESEFEHEIARARRSVLGSTGS